MPRGALPPPGAAPTPALAFAVTKTHYATLGVAPTATQDQIKQDALTTARADVGSDQVRLFQALGGGWAPDEMPVPP